ncbi:MAG: glycyl-radical enzyme activating protein [Armatimonadetes bacterium]|nr:glycyl-radical enzyme activating protein [Candidatus Hippobium faecium]
MKGKIFNIQKFCTHDGAGIRTTVFLKGCPMKCKWCHNPESIDSKPIMAFYKSKCKGCGRCLTVCEQGAIDPATFQFDREKCIQCGKCIDKCLVSAREKFGYEATAEEVLEKVLKDKVFYDNSGGGMTVSGGEPTYQKEFLLNLLKKAKEAGLNNAIETNSFTDNKTMEAIAPYVDTFLMDIKLVNDEKHKYWTGVSNKIILENIRKVSDELNKDILFRIPLIPGVNNTEEDLTDLADFINSLENRHKAELLNYHEIGISKYEACGMEYELRDTKPVDNIDYAIEFLRNKGIDMENE